MIGLAVTLRTGDGICRAAGGRSTGEDQGAIAVFHIELGAFGVGRRWRFLERIFSRNTSVFRQASVWTPATPLSLERSRNIQRGPVYAGLAARHNLAYVHSDERVLPARRVVGAR